MLEPRGRGHGRAAAVVVDGRRVLVIKRLRQGIRYAVLPGGHVEAGESFAETAVRELREETTLEARISRLLWAATHDGRPTEYFLMTDVVGDAVLSGEEEGRSTPDNQCELEWVEPEDFDRLNLVPTEIRAPLAELLRASAGNSAQPGE